MNLYCHKYQTVNFSAIKDRIVSHKQASIIVYTYGSTFLLLIFIETSLIS